MTCISLSCARFRSPSLSAARALSLSLLVAVCVCAIATAPLHCCRVRSVAGNMNVNTYTNGINTDNLPPHMLHQFEAAQQQALAQRVVTEQRQSAKHNGPRNTAWNKSPHVDELMATLELPRMHSNSPINKPFPVKGHQRAHKARGRRDLKQSYGSGMSVKKYLGPHVIWQPAAGGWSEHRHTTQPTSSWASFQLRQSLRPCLLSRAHSCAPSIQT